MTDFNVLKPKNEKVFQPEILPASQSIFAQLGIDSTKVKLMPSGYKRSQYRSIINWLTKYKAKLDASNLEKVKGLLEAFYNLCELKEWEKANLIISVHLNLPSKQQLGNQLDNQLGSWGYYPQQINIYLKLDNQLANKEVNAINTLKCGIAYRWVNNFQKSEICLDKAKAIFEQFNNQFYIVEILNELGVLYGDQGGASHFCN